MSNGSERLNLEIKIKWYAKPIVYLAYLYCCAFGRNDALGSFIVKYCFSCKVK